MKARTLMTAILLIIFIIQPLVYLCLADTWPPVPSVIVFSPLNNVAPHNYPTSLWVEVRVFDNAPAIVSISYSVDGKSNTTLYDFQKRHESFPAKEIFVYSFKSNMSNLSIGDHTLRVYSLDANGNSMSTIQNFSTYEIPKITIISPQNQTYTNNEIPLIYSIDADIVVAASYAVDYSGGIDHIPIDGNSTILGNLTDGLHEISLTVHFRKGNFHSSTYETVDFSVRTIIAEKPLAFNQTYIIGIIIAALLIVVIVAVVIYRRKPKSNNSSLLTIST